MPIVDGSWLFLLKQQWLQGRFLTGRKVKEGDTGAAGGSEDESAPSKAENSQELAAAETFRKCLLKTGAHFKCGRAVREQSGL